MTRNLSLLTILSALLISFSAFAQRTTVINERIQTTYRANYHINVAQWLRVHPADIYQTEIRNLSIRGMSFAMNAGVLEVTASGRLISRLAFGTVPTQIPIHFPLGTRVGDVNIRALGEVHVESVSATVVERRFYPAPTPVPPRYPAPIPPRPVPPRHEPAPRPRPPRHEPAPRPRPPRHEPAPRPTPPRHVPAPRPTPPRGPRR